MVENYGESIQDRSIPNPVTTFAEAYADYRELSHCMPFFKFDNVMIVLHSVEGLKVTLALLPFQNLWIELNLVVLKESTKMQRMSRKLNYI